MLECWKIKSVWPKIFWIIFYILQFLSDHKIFWRSCQNFVSVEGFKSVKTVVNWFDIFESRQFLFFSVGFEYGQIGLNISHTPSFGKTAMLWILIIAKTSWVILGSVLILFSAASAWFFEYACRLFSPVSKFPFALSCLRYAGRLTQSIAVFLLRVNMNDWMKIGWEFQHIFGNTIDPISPVSSHFDQLALCRDLCTPRIISGRDVSGPKHSV